MDPSAPTWVAAVERSGAGPRSAQPTNAAPPTAQRRTTAQPAPTPVVQRSAPGHALTFAPRGMFVHVGCATCGWEGPARRAYASAERDGALHQLVT